MTCKTNATYLRDITLGELTEVHLPLGGIAGDFERFRAKVRAFLRAHEDHIALHKLRRNLPLTPADLTKLNRMLAASGTGSPQEFERAAAESQGLGLFVRWWVWTDGSHASTRRLLARQGAELQPAGVPEPDREPPDRAWRDVPRPALRATVHRLRAARP